jgi:hypothetical protein
LSARALLFEGEGFLPRVKAWSEAAGVAGRHPSASFFPPQIYEIKFPYIFFFRASDEIKFSRIFSSATCERNFSICFFRLSLFLRRWRKIDLYPIQEEVPVSDTKIISDKTLNFTVQIFGFSIRQSFFKVTNNFSPVIFNHFGDRHADPL